MLLVSLLVSFTSCYCHSPRLIFVSLWSRKELQTLQHQCSVHKPWHKKVTSTTNASRVISGCDTTSAFWGKGKKSFWQAWMAFEEVTDTFVYLASHPFEPLDSNCENFCKIERLIVLVYDKTSTSLSINQTRRELFCLKNVTMERMPPTQNALLQHTKRAVYPSFYLGYKYPSTADDSFPKRLWLRTSRQCVEPTLANCSRTFYSLSRFNQVYMQGRLFQLQMWQSELEVFPAL